VQDNVVGNPFAVLTAIVAPAILTNASSVLAQGTSNRLARVIDRTRAVVAQLVSFEPGAADYQAWSAQLAPLHVRAQLLVKALRFYYAGLGLFAASALLSVGGSIESYFGHVVVFLQCRHACSTYRRVGGLWIMRWLRLDGSRNAPRGEILGRGSQNSSAPSPSAASAPLVWCSSPTLALTQTPRVLRS
jgi:Protein of unknown function (DUF2721)